MIIIIGLLAGYPYIKTYLSESAQGRINSLETSTEIIKKSIKYYSNQKEKEYDDNKNKKTGE